MSLFPPYVFTCSLHSAYVFFSAGGAGSWTGAAAAGLAAGAACPALAAAYTKIKRIIMSPPVTFSNRIHDWGI